MTVLIEPPELHLIETELTLADLVREIVNNHPSVTDIQELSSLVFDATPDDMIPQFYRIALPRVVREVIGMERNKRTPINEETPKPRSGKANRSFRQESIHNDWVEQVRKRRFSVPSEGYVVFSVITPAQLRLHGDSVVERGQATVANGRKWQALAESMEENDYATGGDIPEDVLRKFFD